MTTRDEELDATQSLKRQGYHIQLQLEKALQWFDTITTTSASECHSAGL
jgi:hypothetical protein